MLCDHDQLAVRCDKLPLKNIEEEEKGQVNIKAFLGGKGVFTLLQII